MKPRRIPAAAIAAAGMFMGFMGFMGATRATATTASPHSTLAPGHPDYPDQDRFRILLHGRVVGTEDFTISRNSQGWSEHSAIQVNLPGQKGEQDTADLTLAADGAPIRYHWLGRTSRGTSDPSGASGTSGKARSIDVVFRGRSAQVTLRQPGSPPAVETFSFPSGQPVVLLDNNVYAQYAILARLYDWRAGGPQKFSVLIPQDQIPGTVTVESGGRREVAGKRLDRLTVKSPDLEVDLYVDASRRLWLVRVPSSGTEIVRQ